MKKGTVHGGSFIQRWLSRSSNASNNASYGGSDVESATTDSLSLPPLTDSSSTTGSSSGICTPRAILPAPSCKQQISSRFARVKTPRTPPTRYADLPPVQTCRKVSVSLPPNAQRPTALAVTLSPTKLHRLLSYDPLYCPLIYNIASPTSYIRLSPAPPPLTLSLRHPALIPHTQAQAPLQSIPENILSQYAITPPVTRMRIVCDMIPWSIYIRGRNTARNDPMSYLRVLDVLEGIHQSLRTGVTQEEWDSVTNRHQVKKAYMERCRAARAYTLNGYEEKQGLRRVDWFCERTMFAGLMFKPSIPEGGGGSTRSDTNESTWVLIVEPRLGTFDFEV